MMQSLTILLFSCGLVVVNHVRLSLLLCASLDESVRRVNHSVAQISTFTNLIPEVRSITLQSLPESSRHNGCITATELWISEGLEGVTGLHVKLLEVGQGYMSSVARFDNLVRRI